MWISIAVKLKTMLEALLKRNQSMNVSFDLLGVKKPAILRTVLRVCS